MFCAAGQNGRETSLRYPRSFPIELKAYGKFCQRLEALQVYAHPAAVVEHTASLPAAGHCQDHPQPAFLTRPPHKRGLTESGRLFKVHQVRMWSG